MSGPPFTCNITLEGARRAAQSLDSRLEHAHDRRGRATRPISQVSYTLFEKFEINNEDPE